MMALVLQANRSVKGPPMMTKAADVTGEVKDFLKSMLGYGEADADLIAAMFNGYSMAGAGVGLGLASAVARDVLRPSVGNHLRVLVLLAAFVAGRGGVATLGDRARRQVDRYLGSSGKGISLEDLKRQLDELLRHERTRRTAGPDGRMV